VPYAKPLAIACGLLLRGFCFSDSALATRVRPTVGNGIWELSCLARLALPEYSLKRG
jgi:hypothetical protein